MQKIVNLTPEQEAYLPMFRQEWLNVGLSTARVDKERASAAVKALYLAAGEQEPVVMHFDSPAQCILAINFFRHFKIGAEDRANLGDNLGANLRDNLRANLGDNLGANLGANLRDNLSYVETWFWGGQDAPWLAFYEFGRKIGVKYDKEAHLDAYLEYARSCGWMYAYKGIAFVSDRPTVISKDDQTRLHSETGPAVEFSDGYAIHAWHGTTIPREWIEDKANLSAKTALTWANIEQRRAALEIVGWHNVLRELNAKVIDEDGDPEIGTLLEVRLPDLDRPTKILRARCGTGREFAMPVPPHVTTALEANAGSYRFRVGEFSKPEVRT